MEAFGALCALLCTGVVSILPIWTLLRISTLTRELGDLKNQLTALQMELIALKCRDLPPQPRPAASAAAPEERPPLRVLPAGLADVAPPPPPRDPVEPAELSAAIPADPSVDPLPPPAPGAGDAAEGVVGPGTPPPPAPSELAASVRDTSTRQRAAPPSNTFPTPPEPALRPAVSVETVALWGLSIGGGVLFLLAFLFGFREAIHAGWVGPAARFGGGVVLGLLGWGLSVLLRTRHYELPAAALGGAGSAALYGALYAGHARYGLLTQPLAFGLMVAVTAVTVAAAVSEKSRLQAWLGFAGAYATPVLLSSGENKAVAFFGYLVLLNVGLILATRRRGWPLLLGVGGGLTAAMHLGWALTYRAPDQVGVGLGAALILAGLFFWVTWREERTELWGAGAVGGLLLCLVSLSLLMPTDPLRFDPRSAHPLITSLGPSDQLALLFLSVLAALLPLLASRRNAVVLDLAVRLVLSVLLGAYVVGWWTAGEPRIGIAATAGVAIPLISALVLVRKRPEATWATLVLVGAVSVTFGTAVHPDLAELPAVLSLGLGLLAVVLSYAAGPSVGLLTGLLAAAAPLFPPLVDVERLADAAPSLWPAAVLLYLLVWIPVVAGVRPGASDLPRVVAAGAVGPVLFLPLWRLWHHSFGDSVIGLLPVLLGAGVALHVAALVRQGRRSASHPEVVALGALTLLFLALAIPLQLERQWVTIGWAIQVMLLGLFYRRARHNGLAVFAGGLALLVLGRLFLNPEAWRHGGGEGMIILNWTLYLWGVPTLCMLVAAWGFEARGQGLTAFGRGLKIAAILLGFALVNLEVAHGFAHDNQLSFWSEDLSQSMVRSVSWGLYGLLLIGLGSAKQAQWLRLFGLAFLLLGAGKVFVLDLWSLTGFYRVGSIFGLAVVLILGAIAFQRLVLKDREDR